MICETALPGVLDIGLKPFMLKRGEMEMSGRTPRSLGPSGHVDDFARRNLPPSEQWPELLLDRPEFQYPEYLNAAVELTDRIVEKGLGDQIALIGNGRQRTYKELADWSNRLAHALVENYGVKPGNRVLIRSGNNPALVAAWLAATKAGAVVVNTMPMLRAGELAKIVDKAEIALALTDSRIADELVACAKTSRFLKQVVNFDGTSNHDAELDRVALNKPVRFDAVKTGRDDVALLGFTSGTTGEPKATMHFHRDLLIVADGYAREVLNVTPGRCLRRLAAAGLYVRARRARDLPAAVRRHRDAAGKRLAARDGQDHRDLQGDDLLHLADRVSRDDGRDGQGRRSVVAAAGGFRRRNLAGAGVRQLDRARPARPFSTASARPNCCTSSSPTASATPSPAPRGDRFPATRQRSSTTT